jgi:hypothetical protein
MSKLGYTGKLLGELFAFAKANKAWWLIPLIIAFLLIALLIVAGEGAAPFIYTLF